MILSVLELREFVTTTLSDAALQILLDAAEAEIVRAAGASGSATELIDGGFTYLALSRPASSIDAVTETVTTTVTTLASDDYLLRSDGYLLERVNTGTHRRSTWWGRVSVTYTPVDDTALRKGVQLDLVKIDLDVVNRGGIASETIGQWSQSFSRSSETESARAEVLARLAPEPMIGVLGGAAPSWTW